jgi:hypothetical protein
MFMKSVWNSVNQWFYVGQRHIWLEYAALTLAIILPLLLPGYVLTLDMVFTPYMPWPTEITTTYPLDVLLWLLSQLLPGDVVQKIVLFAILLSSGVGMHLFVREITSHKSQERLFELAAYFAGLFYMINPFIYARLMAGQWLVLLGYALLPFLVRALLRLLYRPSSSAAILVVVWTFAVMTASVHFSGIVLVLYALFLIVAVVKYWKKRRELWRFMWRLLVAGLVTVGLSSYWIIPAILGSGVGEIAARADETQFSAFATHSGPLGQVGEVLRLQGFWAEARELFVLPQNVMPLWGVLMLLVWVFVVVGAVKLWRTNRPVAILLIGSTVVGTVLAASSVIQWLSQIFPILGGYREPHKFTVLVVFGFSVLAAFGVLAFVRKRKHKKGWAVVCLALPLLITPIMFWGAGGQLRPVDYPQEWYDLNEQLKNNIKEGDKTLFLPWHMYAPYSFSNGRIIANPAEKFFEIPVVVSDDPEFANVAPNTHDSTRQQIANIVQNPHNVLRQLQDIDISHVVLAKEQDWQEYDFLHELPVLYENDKLIVYEVSQ